MADIYVASYADFYVVGFLRGLFRIGHGLYERAVAIEPALAALHEASKPWWERGDH